PEYPHHIAGAITSRTHSRKIVNFTMFGDPRRYASHEHRIQLVSSDETFREAVSLVTKTRPGKRRTWRVETSRHEYDKGLAFAQSLCQHNDAEVVRRARLTPGKAFQFMPASHLRPGMAVPVVRDGEVREARVLKVETLPYRGFVYDLSVEDLRNYVAGGLLVHNSVYRWRGAHIRNILDFEQEYRGTRGAARACPTGSSGASGFTSVKKSRTRSPTCASRLIGPTTSPSGAPSRHRSAASGPRPWRGWTRRAPAGACSRWPASHRR